MTETSNFYTILVINSRLEKDIFRIVCSVSKGTGCAVKARTDIRVVIAASNVDEGIGMTLEFAVSRIPPLKCCDAT